MLLRVSLEKNYISQHLYFSLNEINWLDLLKMLNKEQLLKKRKLSKKHEQINSHMHDMQLLFLAFYSTSFNCWYFSIHTDQFQEIPPRTE